MFLQWPRFHLSVSGACCSQLESAWNFQQSTGNIFHHTLIMLLHYLGNSEMHLLTLQKMQLLVF